MRAVVVHAFAGVEAIEIEHVPDPEITREQVLVRIRAAGLGFADSLKIGGRYQTKDPLPFVPEMEFAGTVYTVGDAVSGFAIGDDVFGFVPRGAFAEQLAIDAVRLSRKPNDLSYAQAAAVPVNYLTAMYGLRELANVSAGELLLVLGASGGTGTAAIKVGKMLGATIVAAASTEEKRAFARDAGAHEVIDYTRDRWRDDVRSRTGGRAIDVIYDTVGGDVSPVAFRTLGWRGRHLVVGFAAGTIPSLALNIALLKGASLIGVDSAQIERYEPDTYARITAELPQLLASGSLEPPPVEVHAFDRFKEAFERIGSKRALGKVVLELAR